MITRKYKWTVGLSLLSIPMMAIAFLLVTKGGKNGAIAPAVVLFPSGFLSFVLFHAETILAVFGILQYPIYGFIIDRVITKHKNYMIIPVVLMIHMVMVSFVMGHMGDN